jgi:hypothetical protein
MTPYNKIDVPDDPETLNRTIAHDDDIDWGDIVATAEADDDAGPYAFNSADYPTHDEAMKALWNWIHSIAEEVRRRVASDASLDVAGRKGY